MIPQRRFPTTIHRIQNSNTSCDCSQVTRILQLKFTLYVFTSNGNRRNQKTINKPTRLLGAHIQSCRSACSCSRSSYESVSAAATSSSSVSFTCNNPPPPPASMSSLAAAAHRSPRQVRVGGAYRTLSRVSSALKPTNRHSLVHVSDALSPPLPPSLPLLLDDEGEEDDDDDGDEDDPTRPSSGGTLPSTMTCLPASRPAPTDSWPERNRTQNGIHAWHGGGSGVCDCKAPMVKMQKERYACKLGCSETIVTFLFKHCETCSEIRTKLCFVLR
jgi:hypothetical protein